MHSFGDKPKVKERSMKLLIYTDHDFDFGNDAVQTIFQEKRETTLYK